MVQMNKANRIEAAWIEAGEPECTHERYSKEYYLGADTGDYRCLTCGAAWSRDRDKPPPTPNPERKAGD